MKEVPKVPVRTEIVDSVVDVARLQDFCVEDQKKEMALSGTHAFKLVRDSTNADVVLVFSKQYAATKSWKVLAVVDFILLD